MLCYKFGNSFFGGMHENVNHQTFPIYQSREYVAYTHRFKSGLFHVI